MLILFPLKVRELVSAQVFERYDEQLLESMIAAMPNLIRCPREKCILKQRL